MNYKKLFKAEGVTNVGLIGTGAFGRSFLAQTQRIPDIRLPVVCDKDFETAKGACLNAGMKPEDLSTIIDKINALIHGLF